MWKEQTCFYIYSGGVWAAHCLRRNPMANIVNILILFSFLTLFFTFPASTQEPREINTWLMARLSGRAAPGVFFLWPWQCKANHLRRMKASFTHQCQPLPSCAQIPSMVSLPYPVHGNSSHPFAAVSLSWLGFTGIVFWTGCTSVCPSVNTVSFAFGTVTSRQGRRLIIPSYFWRKGVT